MDVRVFISWSGEPSRSIAQALRDWLPSVVQHIEPWMSDEEIKSGTRWTDEVMKALDGTGYGIICVTAANQHQPWLIFEAGALAKRVGEDIARVVPLCIDLKSTEITGPLTTFQARKLDEEGVKKVVLDLMSLRDNPPTKEQTARVFGRMWPELEAQINEAKGMAFDVRIEQRTAEDMLEELVERVRRLDRRNGTTIIGAPREATAEEQAAIDRHRRMFPKETEPWDDPPNSFPESSESDDV